MTKSHPAVAQVFYISGIFYQVTDSLPANTCTPVFQTPPLSQNSEAESRGASTSMDPTKTLRSVHQNLPPLHKSEVQFRGPSTSLHPINSLTLDHHTLPASYNSKHQLQGCSSSACNSEPTAGNSEAYLAHGIHSDFPHLFTSSSARTITTKNHHF
ncbi:uncharacterized protein MELLADRAFT_87833 [Melampsora larici-populina 98AG31]|uniref:Uncharacterized protein n=1 Tax=Melampsora larici-populina (strain 98AG31 / pathotype 3-4-7) TaxID=747676 RepID=F4RPM7_MELLP|nr:uncharacterized protein MELLADRAFT_87833 [Melampsora larici-populina 98AG31]EGG05563.1 hypothetical protein MELLADRAFT_87833 [Melampsora larici-populina 98AG31]